MVSRKGRDWEVEREKAETGEKGRGCGEVKGGGGDLGGRKAAVRRSEGARGQGGHMTCQPLLSLPEQWWIGEEQI